MDRLTGLLGLAVIVLAAYVFSSNRRAIRPAVVFWGLGLQFAFAFVVLKTPFGRVFQAISGGVNALLHYAEEGSVFLFGPILGKNSDQFGVVFAFQVLPIIIFIAALFAVLYYFGVMQLVIRGMAVLMRRVMGASGAEATCVAAGIFMGQTEAPLTIKPFIAGLTRSELFTIMAGGMAHVSGAVMAAYVKIAGVSIEHLLTAVVMTAPATLMLAKMLIPETEQPATSGDVKLEIEKPGVNVIDAAARGAGDGVQLCLNIAGMLIAFTALIAMVNGLVGWLNSLPGLGWLPKSMQDALGIVFAPIAWLMGVPWQDAQKIGNLLGTRLVLNEFFAFIDLGKIQQTIEPKSFVIATFALCGFANLSSIAIQVGGIGALAPTRKSDLALLGLRAVACGSMANFMSACIAGMLL